MHFEKYYSFIDGKVKKNGKISIFNLGFLRGYSAFEYMRTYFGKPFLIKDHLKRFRKSCKGLFLDLQYSDLELEKTIYFLIKKNKLKEAHIRLFLTGGISEDQFMPSKKPTLIIMATSLKNYPKSFYDQGIKVKMHKTCRFLPEYKTSNYLEAIHCLHKMRKKDFFELLYINQENHVLEGTTSNFFMVKDGKVITPKEEVLEGVTRTAIIKLAKKIVPVEQRIIKASELPTIDEAFISASNKEIMPINQIDNIKLKIGPITQKLMEAYHCYIDALCKKK